MLHGSGATPLGVAWYLHPDAGRSGDGGHTAYLRNRDEWRHIDPKLFDTLTMLANVGGRRTVEAIQESGILGDAVFVPRSFRLGGVEERGAEQWTTDDATEVPEDPVSALRRAFARRDGV